MKNDPFRITFTVTCKIKTFIEDQFRLRLEYWRFTRLEEVQVAKYRYSVSTTTNSSQSTRAIAQSVDQFTLAFVKKRKREKKKRRKKEGEKKSGEKKKEAKKR